MRGCIKKRFRRKYLEPVNDRKNNGRNVQGDAASCSLPLSPSFSSPFSSMHGETKSRDFENTFEELFFGIGGGSTRQGRGEGRAGRESYGRLVTTFLMAVRLVFKRLSA